jgi:hypothetical protein
MVNLFFKDGNKYNILIKQTKNKNHAVIKEPKAIKLPIERTVSFKIAPILEIPFRQAIIFKYYYFLILNLTNIKIGRFIYLF